MHESWELSAQKLMSAAKPSVPELCGATNKFDVTEPKCLKKVLKPHREIIGSIPGTKELISLQSQLAQACLMGGVIHLSVVC